MTDILLILVPNIITAICYMLIAYCFFTHRDKIEIDDYIVELHVLIMICGAHYFAHTLMMFANFPWLAYITDTSMATVSMVVVYYLYCINCRDNK